MECEPREAGAERDRGLLVSSHGQECSQTALTSHLNPLQLRTHCPPPPDPPNFKDQQPPLEQLGHHHGDQARVGVGWGCFKVFYGLKTSA